MALSIFERSTPSPASARETFEWHVRPGALRRLMPPWEDTRVVQGSGPTERLQKGARTTIRLGLGPAGLHWEAEIADLQAHKLFFVDRQVSGPFKSWSHRHEISGRGEETSTLTDRITYELPLGPLGRVFGGGHVRGKLERMFAWRHRVMVADLEAHGRAAAAGVGSMTVAVSGASGLVGRALCAFLRTGGHTVLELVRREPNAAHEVRWSPQDGAVDAAALEGVDAIVHLAGESIFGLRWTESKKQRIAESRVRGTRALVQAVGRMERKPKVFVSASAIGFYGDRGDEVLTEESPRGEGFLSDTCVAWEAELDGLPPEVRQARMRLGIVLDPGGGALATMLPAFRFGLGGKLGSGQQWFPWVVLDDVVGAFHHALWNESVRGPANVVAPGELRQAEFAKSLAGVLKRPAIVPAPRLAMRAALGAEQADEMLLSSVRVHPGALERAGYRFRYPTLTAGLKHALGLER